MSYVKQEWNGYDETKTIEENIGRYAVAMPEYLNHMEDGIVELDRKAFSTVEVQTLDAGSEASAQVQDDVLHLQIPAGPSGKDGIQGLKGDKGDPGADGKDGVDGNTLGVASAEPADGSIPINDLQLASKEGDIFISPSGKFYSIISITDGTATVADTEVNLPSTGEGGVGTPGKDGADGKSAYDIAVDNGYIGTEEEWLLSLKGEKGEQGIQGIEGPQGVQGEVGPKGDKGDPGKDGTNGIDGLPGEIGPKGDKGDPGEQGPQGEKGDKGDPGENGIDGSPGIGVATVSPTMSNPTNGIIPITNISPEISVGCHVIVPTGDIYKVSNKTDAEYEVQKTSINISSSSGEGGSGIAGADGHSVGVSVVEPIEGEISISQVNSVSQIGDHFIAPSGDIYKITNIEEDKYMSENTGVSIQGAGAGVNYKGEAIGHCSNLVVYPINNGSDAPYIQITYTDPENEGVPYGGTVVAIKENSLPATPEDADIVSNTMEKNAYETTPLQIDIQKSDVLQRNFFVTLFPYSGNGVYNLLKKEKKKIKMQWHNDAIVSTYTDIPDAAKIISTIQKIEYDGTDYYIAFIGSAYAQKIVAFNITDFSRVGEFSISGNSTSANKKCRLVLLGSNDGLAENDKILIITQSAINGLDAKYFFNNYLNSKTTMKLDTTSYSEYESANHIICEGGYWFSIYVTAKTTGGTDYTLDLSSITVNSTSVSIGSACPITNENKKLFTYNGEKTNVVCIKRYAERTYAVVFSNGLIGKALLYKSSNSKWNVSAAYHAPFTNIVIPSIIAENDSDDICMDRNITHIWHTTLNAKNKLVTVFKYTLMYDDGGDITTGGIPIDTEVVAITVTLDIESSILKTASVESSQVGDKVHILIRDDNSPYNILYSAIEA